MSRFSGKSTDVADLVFGCGGYYDKNGKMVEKFKLRGYDWIKQNQEKAKADPGEEVSSND